MKHPKLEIYNKVEEIQSKYFDQKEDMRMDDMNHHPQ